MGRVGDDRTILIAAMTADGVIGAGDGMPWDVPEEYAHYLSLVRGHPIVMGRRTWEVFAPDLPGETFVVLTRRPGSLPGVETAATIEDALARARAYGPRVFVAGGASVYAQAMPHADAMYLSTIDGDFEGDVRFPAFDAAAWPVRVEHRRSGFVFRVHRRAEPYRRRSRDGGTGPGDPPPGRPG